MRKFILLSSGKKPLLGRPFRPLHVGRADLSSPSKKAKLGSEGLQNFIDDTNAEYERLHLAFEQQFWGTKMALSGDYSTAQLTATKSAMESMLASQDKLEETRRWLSSGLPSAEQAKCLAIFQKTLQCYIMESPEAVALREQITGLESELEEKRNKMTLGYTDGEGKFVEVSSVALRNRMRTNAEESMRETCYKSLRTIGDFVCQQGFPEIVKLRNRLAKKLGFADFYDYKVTAAEGFGKDQLFKILDTLEQGSRPLMEAARAQLATEKGEAALKPWNTSFRTAGDVTSKLDPYFPFDRAVERWGRSFFKLGIRYQGARMILDLLDRKGKYSNGFCHWPQPAWRRSDGTFVPSVAQFTSLADPAAVGSGLTALTTLMHEAGHAAHFANIDQPSPLFSQERAPTSVAYAENQSMFLDSLVQDAAWRVRYCFNSKGERFPWELHAEDLTATHPYAVFDLRSMLAVPYFEKGLYELPEDQVTTENIQRLADEIEKKIQGGAAGRPLLSVPHIVSGESSCYYHGYVLAEMSVHQTREHFLSHGAIVDNPEVGRALTETYWRPGNSEQFLDLVQKLTGKPLTGDAWIERLQTPLADLLSSEQKAYQEGATSEQDLSEVDLNMRVMIMDGDALLADSQDGGFNTMCAKFAEYVQNRFKK